MAAHRSQRGILLYVRGDETLEYSHAAKPYGHILKL